MLHPFQITIHSNSQFCAFLNASGLASHSGFPILSVRSAFPQAGTSTKDSQEAHICDHFPSPSYNASAPEHTQVIRVNVGNRSCKCLFRVHSCILLTGSAPAEETWDCVAGCPPGEYILQGYRDFTQYSGFRDHWQNHCSRGKGR